MAASRIPIGVVRSMAADDLADLGDREWSGKSARRGAVGAPEAAAYLPDGFGGDGVLGAGHAVDVPDGGTGHVEGAGCLAGFGAFGQVGAQGERVTGQSRDGTGGAPAFPLAPHVGVDGSGGLGARGGDGGGDAGGVGLGEPGREADAWHGGRADEGRSAGREGGVHQSSHGRVVSADAAAPAPGARPQAHAERQRETSHKADFSMTGSSLKCFQARIPRESEPEIRSGGRFEPATSGLHQPLRNDLDDCGSPRVYTGRPRGHFGFYRSGTGSWPTVSGQFLAVGRDLPPLI